MADEGVETPMDTTHTDVENQDISDKTPEGEKVSIQEQATSSEVTSQKDMGCTSSTESDADNNDENKDTTSKLRQQTMDEHFKSDKRDNSTHPNTDDQLPKKAKTDNESSSQPKSTTSRYPESDEDNENDPNQYRSGPITRSSAALPKLRINFDDSDDDNSSNSSWAQRDIAEYRGNYPGARSNPKITDNYDFYTNKISSYPDGDLIDNIHKKWFGDYRKLEFHHGYIQWLFPLQEKGLNWSAEPLQKHEIEKIKKDKKALKRILKSYELMLDFYGFELIDKKTGEIRRLPNDSYKARFRNLNTSSHNFLRITRILKCLGEFDYEYLKFPFLEKILQESIIENTLPNCLRSCKDYWIETLRSQDERRAIRKYARELIEYRNKGLTPPKPHHAIRPKSTSNKNPEISASTNHNDDDSN